MEAKIVAASPDLSLRRLISRYVGDLTKRKQHRQRVRSTADKHRGMPSSDKEMASAVGDESPTSSILELSEVMTSDLEKKISPSECQSHQRQAKGKNGDFWMNEDRRNYSELKDCIEKAFQSTVETHGFSLKFSADLPQRIADGVTSIASPELCGLRGCRVHLRLLHEDVANKLRTRESEPTVVVGRAEKCVSWPDASCVAESQQPPILTFADLPDADAILTNSVHADSDNDSGFFEMPKHTKGKEEKLRRRLSSPSIPTVFPSLSSASPLGVACADLGRFVMCDSSAALTFEIYVYLAPVVSWSWKVQRFFYPSIKLGDSEASAKPFVVGAKTVTAEANFTLVKKKLYRARSAFPEIVRCTTTI